METTLHGTRIAGLAVAVPKNEESILDSQYESEEMRRRFVAATGIERRRVCLPEQFCSDLACAAADRLLNELEWSRDEVDNLIFVTQTPDLTLPATACLIQNRLGLSSSCAAFDVNLGCSGYTYGLFIAGRMATSGCKGKTLLLVGDAAGKLNLPSKKDKAAPLFGDAASATALEWDAGVAPMHFQLHTDGSGWDAIMERRPGGRPGLDADSFHYEETEEGTVKIRTHYQMKGEDVFNFSVRTVPPAVEKMLEFAGWPKESADAYVFHQANRMINEFIRKKLELEPGKVPSSLKEFGNTSSATIPITLVNQMRSRLQNECLRLILCGFGVGLSWGTVACETDRIICSELVEI